MDILAHHQVSNRILSLIVITRSDQRLPNCLSSIEESARQTSGAELVLVPDASSPEYTQRVVQLVQTLSIPVILARTQQWEHIGSVRNRGAMLATSPLLVYVDSDCVVAANYVQQALTRATQHPITTGKVVFRPRGSSMFSRLNSLVRTYEYEQEFRHYVHSPNLCIQKKVLTLLGGYDQGVPGDDFVLNQKAYLADYIPVYCEALHMIHDDDEHFVKTVKTWLSYGMGKAYRFKREQQLFGTHTLPLSFSIPRLDTTVLSLFAWVRLLIMNMGFLYGLLHWKAILPLTFPVTCLVREKELYRVSRLIGMREKSMHEISDISDISKK